MLGVACGFGRFAGVGYGALSCRSRVVRFVFRVRGCTRSLWRGWWLCCIGGRCLDFRRRLRSLRNRWDLLWVLLAVCELDAELERCHATRRSCRSDSTGIASQSRCGRFSWVVVVLVSLCSFRLYRCSSSSCSGAEMVMASRRSRLESNGRLIDLRNQT